MVVWVICILFVVFFVMLNVLRYFTPYLRPSEFVFVFLFLG